MAEEKKQVLVENIGVNGGHALARGKIEIYHDRAQLIRESDPQGRIIEHRKVTTQRMIDRLYERGAIPQLHHLAGTMLRDYYDRSGLSMASLAAQDAGKPYVSGGGGDPISVADEESFRQYNNAMRQLGRDWRGVARHVVIEDGTPESYGKRTRSSGMVMLCAALDRLIGHYGLVAKGRGRQNA